MESGEEAIEKTVEAIAEVYEEPMSLEAAVDYALENPRQANFVPSDQYLLQAIESQGKREVMEKGQWEERWRFFDDPWNDGENAVVSNTDTLNQFVENLRRKVEDRGNSNTISWIRGATGTGKSEWRRCISKGLKAYSKKEEGRRYTVELNTESLNGSSTVNIGFPTNQEEEEEERQDVKDKWIEDPLQANPLALLDEDVREEVYEEMNRERDYPIKPRRDLGPFSEAFLDILRGKIQSSMIEDEGKKSRAEKLQKLTDKSAVQVKNYIMDEGKGISILNAEDSNPRQVKKVLAGYWNPHLLEKYGSEGKKNPLAFSYDGILSRGNGGVTFIEDAFEHRELVKKLHSVPEENSIKIPEGGPRMDVDSHIFVISNNDLAEHLQMEDEQYRESDPNQSLERRFDEYHMNYITEYGMAVQLLKREVVGNEGVDLITDSADSLLEKESQSPEKIEELREEIISERQQKVREAVFDDGIEYAPHTMEAAGLYAVMTRLNPKILPGSSRKWEKKKSSMPEGEHGGKELSLLEKAKLYERGRIIRGNTELRYDDFDFPEDEEIEEGIKGVPVTYLADVVASLSTEDRNRRSPEGHELDLSSVVMPYEILEASINNLTSHSMFDEGEEKDYSREGILEPVKNHLYKEMKKDVLEAMIGDKMPSDDRIERYVNAVLDCYGVDIATDEANPDLFMKDFETKFLGFNNEGYYADNSPAEGIEKFRKKQIKDEYSFQSHQKDDKATWKDIRALKNLKRLDWDLITNFDEFEDVEMDEASDWKSSNFYFDREKVGKKDTYLTDLKTKTLERMVDKQGYTRESAFLTARTTIEEAFERGELG